MLVAYIIVCSGGKVSLILKSDSAYTRYFGGMIMIIKEYERGLVFRKGNYVKFLMPGKYCKSPFRKEDILICDVHEPFQPEGIHMDYLLKDEKLIKELEIIDVNEHQLALHLKEGIFIDLYGPGKHIFWKQDVQEEYIIIDTRNPEINDVIDTSITEYIDEYIDTYEVDQFEKGYLYYDNLFQRELNPGVYRFWKNSKKIKIVRVDLKEQILDMNGQEIMTSDKVTLRLNFVCYYRVNDPKKVLEYSNLTHHLYLLLQLVLREYVGDVTLDDLIKNKQEVSGFVLEALKEKGSNYGIEFTHAGLKDIILPGEIKDILNTVLIAEKKAQANLIARREEIASTRSLLNTAKLMNDNETLYKLKEMEYIERICDKIGHINLNGNGNVISQLNDLFRT